MLMGSFNSSHHQRIVPQQQEDQDPQITSDLQLYNQHQHHQYQIAQPPLLMSRGLTSRQLLISCAELISQLDISSAHRLISILSSSNSSPSGDSTERLVHQFIRALSLRLPLVTAAPQELMSVAAATASSPSTYGAFLEAETDAEEEALQSCYLTLNQITPFIRFSHLTANQAILEAIDSSQHTIHIIDFDIKHGVQWPPFMQALAERSYGSSSSLNHPPPPMLRITATGRDLTLLRRTGERLLRFAQSLGLTFHFRPIVLLNDVAMIDYLNPASLGLFPDETLAVNCVLYLHRLLTDDAHDLHLFLDKIRGLNPKIVTVAEREANLNSPMFLNRFVEAVDHYGAVFGSLEATLPPNSRERLAVEQVWFGREIADVVAADDDQRRKQLRHERYENWEIMMRRSGFSNVPLSPFALSQAKLLLRLHYPSEGYQLHSLKDSFFLGWMNRPLFSVSSWN
ncbi:scarecrow-like protein 18 [Argentina anserina]|uniref:scarecrow-like protein 18 n=1 Tax=Argentina anserina TaxID=57926 RepID=UPI002176475F|nr:scarecrow-like protein 18 [Potentilla anserina]